MNMNSLDPRVGALPVPEVYVFHSLIVVGCMEY